MCVYEGREYESDCGRIIKKFDIYICDLGEIDEGSPILGKKRPCVIISSNELNCPKSGQYLIAPIRTEHTMEVKKETLEDIVKAKRKLGRFYVPLKSGMGEDEYRFIDMTQLRIIENSKVLYYRDSIINSQVMTRINTTLIEMFMGNDEVSEVFDQLTSPTPSKEIKEIQKPKKMEEAKVYTTETKLPQVKVEDTNSKEIKKVKEPETKTHKGDNVPKLFYTLYDKFKNGEISASEAALQLKMTADSFIGVVKSYEKSLDGPKQKSNTKDNFPMGFSVYYKLYKTRKITQKEFTEKTGIPKGSINYYIKKYENLNPDLVVTLK